MIVCLLIAEVVGLSWLDRERFGTWITPLTVLGFPYAAVVLLAYFVSEPLGFVAVFPPSVLIWMVGLLLVWATGQFLSWALLDFKFNPLPFLEAHAENGMTSAIRVGTALAIVSVIVMAVGTIAALKAAGGLSQVGSADFKSAYSHGVCGHALVWSCLFGILLIGSWRRGSRMLLLLIVAIVFFLVLGQVKGRVLQLVIGGALFRVARGQLRLSPVKLAGVLATTCVIFSLGYLIAMLALDSDALLKLETYSFLSKHYLFYLFSGPLSFGEALRNRMVDVGGDWHSIFAPFANLYRVLLHSGDLVTIGSSHDKGVIIDDSAIVDNVYTFFGTLYLYLGAGGAALYVVGVSFVSYGLLVCAQLKREPWLTALYCYVAANLSLGFFEFYFWHLDAYELGVLATAVAYVSRSFNSNRRTGWPAPKLADPFGNPV